MLNVALIGYGYWGPNIARNLFELEGFDLKYICDKNPHRLEIAGKKHPTCKLLSNPLECLRDDSIHAVVIATPIFSHFDLTKLVLENKKHVLVEKPLASNSIQARELCALAEKNGRVLMVDHTFLYTGAVEKIHSLIQSGEMGNILYIDSVRINLGLFQQDTNVIWDLAPHDISIFNYILGKRPTQISAVGAAHLLSQENIAYLTMLFDDSTMAHVHINWMSPVKVRSMIVGGSKKMVIYDDVQSNEKLKIYDTGAQKIENPYDVLVQYRTGDVLVPKLDTTEALKKELQEFKAAIVKGESTRSSGYFATNIIDIIEAAELSIRQDSAYIKVTYGNKK